MSPYADHVDLDSIHFTPELLGLIDAAFAREHQVIPIHSSTDFLCIAIGDMDDLTAVDVLRESMGKDIEVRLARPDQLCACIAEHYPEPPSSV
jgi:hypothetical protein